MSMSESLGPVNVALYGKRDWADVIKLKIWRWQITLENHKEKVMW